MTNCENKNICLIQQYSRVTMTRCRTSGQLDSTYRVWVVAGGETVRHCQMGWPVAVPGCREQQEASLRQSPPAARMIRLQSS